jgi:hypothetical protein
VGAHLARICELGIFRKGCSVGVSRENGVEGSGQGWRRLQLSGRIQFKV